VEDLHLISGDPLLVEAAFTAARQWLYKPTLLNDEPVEVQTIIYAKFALPVDPSMPHQIKVGSILGNGKMIRQPRPVYPPEAKRAGIQGVVRLSVNIDEDGYVVDVTVISGHPALVPAAIDAVKQWIYQPTLLNGEPVAIKTQIDVPFNLSQ
jgi:TonB family protein